MALALILCMYAIGNLMDKVKKAPGNNFRIIGNWFHENVMVLNAKNYHYMYFGNGSQNDDFIFNGIKSLDTRFFYKQHFYKQSQAEIGKKSRSSHQRCSMKKVVLRNFAKFTGKYVCQSLFFNKVAGRPATLLKKRL